MLKLRIVISKYLDLFTILLMSLIITEIFGFLDLKTINIYNISLVSLWLLSDLLFKNKSMFKKILRLEIIKSNNKYPQKIELVIRKLFSSGIINTILIIITGKTIGDYIFKTKIEYINDYSKQSTNKNSLSILKNILMFIVAPILCIGYLFINFSLRYMYNTQFYDKIEYKIPKQCKLTYSYRNSNDSFKDYHFINYRHVYRKYMCDKSFDIMSWQKVIFDDEKNYNLETQIIKLINKRFKNINSTEKINFSDDYVYYYKNGLSKIYIIKFKGKNELYIIETTD